MRHQLTCAGGYRNKWKIHTPALMMSAAPPWCLPFDTIRQATCDCGVNTLLRLLLISSTLPSLSPPVDSIKPFLKQRQEPVLSTCRRHREPNIINCLGIYHRRSHERADEIGKQPGRNVICTSNKGPTPLALHCCHHHRSSSTNILANIALVP